MACRLDGTKLLSEPMMEFSLLDPWEQTLVKSLSTSIHFHSRKCIWKCCPATILSQPQCIITLIPSYACIHHRLASIGQHSGTSWVTASCQLITRPNVAVLSIITLGRNFSQISIFIFFILFQIYLYRVNHSVTLFFHGALLQSKIYRYKEHIYTHP